MQTLYWKFSSSDSAILLGGPSSAYAVILIAVMDVTIALYSACVHLDQWAPTLTTVLWGDIGLAR